MCKRSCCCFLTPSPSVFSLSSSLHPGIHSPLKRPRPRSSPTCSLSDPFPLPDIFQRPSPIFLPPPFSITTYRADILGTLFYTFGLYLGFSQKVQWGYSLRQYLGRKFGSIVGDAFHGVPFFMAGLAIDAVVRGSAGTTWALAGGLGMLLWGGVFEAGRVGKSIETEDEEEWNKFREFADSRIRKSGRCHLADVVRAYRDYRGGRVVIGEGMVRRFVRKWAPSARRSPNGFYRQLSVIPLEELRKRKK